MRAEVFSVTRCTGLTMNRCWVASLTPGKGLAAASSFCRAEIRPSGLRGELNRGGVGEVFALARYRHLHGLRGDRGKHRHDQQHDDQNGRTARALAVVAACDFRRCSYPIGACAGPWRRPVRSGRRSPRRWSCSGVSRLAMWPISWPTTPCSSSRDSVCSSPRVTTIAALDVEGTGGEGVERVGLHHHDLGHRHASCDRHLLDHV